MEHFMSGLVGFTPVVWILIGLWSLVYICMAVFLSTIRLRYYVASHAIVFGLVVLLCVLTHQASELTRLGPWLFGWLMGSGCALLFLAPALSSHSLYDPREEWDATGEYHYHWIWW
jgi:uncharacterized membrane protein